MGGWIGGRLIAWHLKQGLQTSQVRAGGWVGPERLNAVRLLLTALKRIVLCIRGRLCADAIHSTWRVRDPREYSRNMSALETHWFAIVWNACCTATTISFPYEIMCVESYAHMENEFCMRSERAVLSSPNHDFHMISNYII